MSNSTTIGATYLIPVIHFDAVCMPSGRFYEEIAQLAKREYVGKRLTLTLPTGKDAMFVVTDVSVSMSSVALVVKMMRE